MIYDVDLDDGRTVTLEADNPPSEQDIYAALQSYQPPAPRPQLQSGDLAGPEARQIPDLTTTTQGGPPAKLASFAETIQEPLALAPEMVVHEGITVPGLSETIKKAGEQYVGGLGIRGVSTPTPPEQFTPAQKLASGAIQGVDELVEGVANFLSSSQGIGETGAAASPLAPAVYLKWANDMVRGGMLNAGEAYDAYKRGDWETFAKQVTGGLGMLLGAGAVTKHGVSKIAEPIQAFTGGTPRLDEANAKALAATIPPKLPEITKAGETYASTIPETTSVPQLEVRPRVGEETSLRQSGQAPGTQQPVSGSPQAEVLPAVEPPKVEAKPEAKFYRGTNSEREYQTGDEFYSISPEVAAEYAASWQFGKPGEVKEIKASELPKKLFAAYDKESLKKELGLKSDINSSAFDQEAKAVLKPQGYDGINYEAGTWFEDGPQQEIHVFGKLPEPTPVGAKPTKEVNFSDENSKWESYYSLLNDAYNDRITESELRSGLNNLNVSQELVDKMVKLTRRGALNGLTESQYKEIVSLRNKAMGDDITEAESKKLDELHSIYFSPRKPFLSSDWEGENAGEVTPKQLSQPSLKEQIELQSPEEWAGEAFPKTAPIQKQLASKRTRRETLDSDFFADYSNAIASAIKDRRPVSVKGIEAYSGFEFSKLPDGYVREGDRYVYKPTTPSETAVVTTPTPEHLARTTERGLESKIRVSKDRETGQWNVVEDFYESGTNKKVDAEFLESFDTEEEALRHAATLKKSETVEPLSEPIKLSAEDKADVRMDEPGITRKTTPNVIVIQLRDLESRPIREVQIKPTGDPMTDAQNVVRRIRQEAADDNRISLRESGGNSTDPNGMGILHFTDSPNGPAFASVRDLVEARKKTKFTLPESEAEARQLAKKQFSEMKATETKAVPPIEPKGKEPLKAASQIQTEVSKVAKTEGVRSAKDIKAELVSRLEKAIEDAPSDSEFNSITGKPITDIAKKAKGTISISIPGDGDFTVINRKENVASVLAQAKRISTTSGTPPIVPRTKAIGDIADQAEAAAKAYGSPEAAYLSAKRQRDEVQQQGPPANAEDRKVWNDQIENADYLIREIYGNTKAAKLEAGAEAARDRVATYKEGAKGFEKEIARIEAIKRKTAAHKERLDDLKERYAQNQSFIKMNERNADNWEQQAAQEKAKLGIEPPASAIGSVGSVGPGAASPGDVPKQAQIEQLTAAFKNINAQKAPLIERIKQAFDFGKQRDLSRDLVGRTLSALKTSGDYLVDTWKGVNDVDPILKVKGQLSSELELRGWRMRQAMKDMKRAVPDIKIREAISKWVDAGGDAEVLRNAAETVPANRRAAYERALQLTPEEKIFAEHIKSYFESRLQEAKDAGVLENGIEDYIHRIYPRETPWRKGVLNAIQNGVLNTRRPGLAMKRVFEFDAEAEKEGLKPIGDFIPRVLDYEASLSKVIASREAVKRFTEIKMPDGRPMLDTAGIGVPIEGAEGVREATLIKPSFKPGEHQIGTDGKPTLNYRKDYQARDYGALKKWKWATKDENGNPIFVQGDVLIHPDAVHRIDALLEPSKIRKYAAARAALAVGSTFKQTMLDFSGFHQVQIAIHGLEHKVNPFNLVKEIDAENPNVRGLLRGGVTLGGEHVTGMAQEGLVGRSLSRQIPGLGPLMQTYHSWLFQDFIPRVKMTMALHALERNRSRFAKDLASGKMTEDALFYQTAKEANAAFGELNYVMLERSKTAQDMARMILLAPDFLEARGRFVGQSLTKPGGEQRMALLLGALALYTTARVMNKAISGEYHNEPENLFSVVHNGKAYSIRTVQGDVLHAIEEPVKFWLHRLNPTMTRPLFELLSGRDEFGRKRNFWQVIGDTVSNAIPISMRHGREQSIWTSLLNAFGGSVRRNSEVRRIYDAAQEWKKANNIRTEPGEFIYDPSQDIYRPLKLAILDGDTGTAMLEYRKLIDSKVVTPKQASEHFSTYARSPFSGSRANETKFYNSLSEDEKKSYEGAKQEKQRILQGFIKAGGMSPKPVQLKPVTRQK